MRVLRGTGVKILSPPFLGTDGETPTDTTGTPTVQITRADGSTLTSPPSVVSEGSGVYSITLTAAHTADLDRLSVVWTGTVSGIVQRHETWVDIVGAHYLTVPQIRAEPGLSDLTRFPLARVLDVRDAVSDLVEDYCGVAFVPRYEREAHVGTGSERLIVRRLHGRTVRAVTVSGATQDATGFTIDDHGVVTWMSGVFTAGAAVVVAYEHGLDAPPESLRREMLAEIRARLLAREVRTPVDAISETSPDGVTVRFSTPDLSAGRPTGNMRLDAVMNALAHRIPGIA